MNELFLQAILFSIFASTFGVATVILLAAFGELVTERAGIWNMAGEGTILTACLVAYVVMVITGSALIAGWAAMSAGLAVGLLIAFMTVTLRVDHFVTGLGFNLLASGLTLFSFCSFTGGGSVPRYATLDWVPIPFCRIFRCWGRSFSTSIC